jgi:hypothetical protein
VYDYSTRVGEHKKLKTRWMGPYTVIEKKSDVVYVINKDGHHDSVSVSRMKRAHVDDEAAENAHSGAAEAHDYQLQVIEKEIEQLKVLQQQLLVQQKQKEEQLKQKQNNEKDKTTTAAEAAAAADDASSNSSSNSSSSNSNSSSNSRSSDMHSAQAVAVQHASHIAATIVKNENESNETIDDDDRREIEVMCMSMFSYAHAHSMWL